MDTKRIRYEEDAVAGIGISCVQADCRLDITHYGPHDSTPRRPAVPAVLQPTMSPGQLAELLAPTMTVAEILVGLEDARLRESRRVVASLDAMRGRRRG